MNIIMAITSKRQVTFTKDLMDILGLKSGDKIIARVEDSRVILEPSGSGILDFAGKLGSFSIPKGKTLEDLINDAAIENAGKNIR